MEILRRKEIIRSLLSNSFKNKVVTIQLNNEVEGEKSNLSIKREVGK